MMFSPEMLYEILEAAIRLYKNRDQEERGEIPPLTMREAERGYGRRNVERWIRQGRVKPYQTDNRSKYVKYTEVQMAKRADSLAKKWTDGRAGTQYYSERLGFICDDEVDL
ncbi:MAG: hypothetical protein MJZ81_06555 [Bacteroidales bacterium]|nr:hypothetical protein [Bacteroidales bacterium]